MDPRLYLQPRRPAGVVLASTSLAFNVFINDSVLIIDLSAGDVSLPGAVRCDASATMPKAITMAQQVAMEEVTPDDKSTCLLLHASEQQAVEAAQALLTHGYPPCRRVYCVSRDALAKTHGFLFVPFGELGSYPNEIIPGQLYLGSAHQANDRSIAELGITHVVRVVERKLAPAGCRQLLCNIPDADDADLSPVLREALPFIESALGKEDGGKVLVHCEKGASRSVSVVCAYLMRESRGALTLADALDRVKTLRPCAQPNGGFLRQLSAFDPNSVPSPGPTLDHAQASKYTNKRARADYPEATDDLPTD